MSVRTVAPVVTAIASLRATPIRVRIGNAIRVCEAKADLNRLGQEHEHQDEGGDRERQGSRSQNSRDSSPIRSGIFDVLRHLSLERRSDLRVPDAVEDGNDREEEACRREDVAAAQRLPHAGSGKPNRSQSFRYEDCLSM